VRLETERLILRTWRDSDKPLYAQIIGDPIVRRFYPGVGSYADADTGIERARQRLRDFGFSFLAVERKQDGAFMGMLGMAPFRDELRAAIPTHPAVEIGWQLGRDFWGQGYAPEGARAFLDHAWSPLNLPEVVAITYEGNWPSRRVMEKIGMTRDLSADFLHPDVPPGHKVRPHVLYRIANPVIAG
jgi:RimJ/RimL family protein N-acetyltransferase